MAMLAAARTAPPGSADELNAKGLLALNLRKLGPEAALLAPRAYVVLPATADSQQGGGAGTGGDSEFAAWLLDFKVSRALAILKLVAVDAPEPEPERELEPKKVEDGARPEGLWDREVPTISWEPPPSQPVDEACVAVALAVAARCASAADGADPMLFPARGGLSVSDDEWETLRSARLTERAPLPADAAETARAALAALPPSCQLGLLRDNVWLLKPSLNGGGNGRGIMLLDRLPLGGSPGSGRDDVPALLLAWVAAVGRSGSGGQNDLKHGFVLQKAVERPHLLNRELLLRHWPTGHPLPSQPLPALTPDDGPAEHFKYNWRAYVLASLAAPCPSAYLYEAGYVDLCPLAFTRALNPGAQVSNTVRQRSCCRSRLRVGLSERVGFVSRRCVATRTSVAPTSSGSGTRGRTAST